MDRHRGQHADRKFKQHFFATVSAGAHLRRPPLPGLRIAKRAGFGGRQEQERMRQSKEPEPPAAHGGTPRGARSGGTAAEWKRAAGACVPAGCGTGVQRVALHARSQVPRQVEDTQLGTHTQHSPLLALHWPADDVTVQGADTLVSKTEALQSQVSPHTATVLVTAHTQHSPLPTEQLPVDDRTEHIALSLLTSVAVPQSQVSPHTAIVRFCVTWTRAAGCGCPSSPTRTP